MERLQGNNGVTREKGGAQRSSVLGPGTGRRCSGTGRKGAQGRRVACEKEAVWRVSRVVLRDIRD